MGLLVGDMDTVGDTETDGASDSGSVGAKEMVGVAVGVPKDISNGWLQKVSLVCL